MARQTKAPRGGNRARPGNNAQQPYVTPRELLAAAGADYATRRRFAANMWARCRGMRFRYTATSFGRLIVEHPQTGIRWGGPLGHLWGD